MVRASISTSEPRKLEEKKSTAKRNDVSPRKKATGLGVWPCKINGCNKQFAREADLKRHQRTTKLHSMPSFPCPQCDATFTRTDALRRHQKSRHNGLVIEPAEPSKDVDDSVSSPSHSSRSGTPSSKGKERTIPRPSSTTAYGLPDEPTPSGPSKYYRSHTMNITPHIPSRCTAIPRNDQTAHPTSNNIPSWPYLWPPGGNTYVYPIYYQPSPHYRSNGNYPSPLQQLPRLHPVDASNGTSNPSSDSTSAGTSPLSEHAPVDLGVTTLNPSESHITQESVQTALEALVKAQEEATRGMTNGLGHASYSNEDLLDHSGPGTRHPSEVQADLDAKIAQPEKQHIIDHPLSMGDCLNGMHDYGPPLERPEPMEHLLTEDGEPMLNPAELLTQESLASPPPL